MERAWTMDTRSSAAECKGAKARMGPMTDKQLAKLVHPRTTRSKTAAAAAAEEKQKRQRVLAVVARAARERAAREMQKVAAVLRASRAWRRTEERVQVRLWLVRVSTDMAESMRSRRSS